MCEIACACRPAANNQTFWVANTTVFDYNSGPMKADVGSVLRVLYRCGVLEESALAAAATANDEPASASV
jgi:hypothetical protein